MLYMINIYEKNELYVHFVLNLSFEVYSLV